MKKLLVFMGIFALILPLLFLGCGDTGSQGPKGDKGDTGDTGEAGPGLAAQPESCSICHNGNVARNGVTHQESYDELYQDGVIQVSGLAYTNDGTNDIVTFNMTKAGLPFDCTELDAYQDPPVGTGSSLGIYFEEYTAASRSFDPPAPLTSRLSIGSSESFSSRTQTITPSTLSYNAGTNLCTSTKAQSTAGDLSGLTGLVVLYGRNEARNAQEESPELEFTNVVQAKYPFAAMLELPAPGSVTYASAANVTGCEKCHTVPFLKHGYIYGLPGGVAGTDFYTCKGCHVDNGAGGHFEWQLLVDDPQLAASYLDGLTTAADNTAIRAKYAYKTRLMNDVHMSHAMEFPYPQSMANCVVCHEGKLANVLTDANFTFQTCKSCHPVTGGTDLPDADGDFTVDTINDPEQAPPLEKIWLDKNVTFHSSLGPTATCADVSSCHQTGGAAKSFGTIHTGYDTRIYYSLGQKFSSAITVSIDSASFDPATNVLTWSFSAAGSAGGLNATDIVPTVMVGLYGYDTKDFIQGPHESEPTGLKNSPATGNASNLRALEYTVGEDSITGRNSPYIQVSGGNVTVDLSLPLWAGWIAADNVVRVEIAVVPELKNAAGEVVALNAKSRTFDLVANAFDDAFYPAIVKVENGCNNCHDALGRTFHDPDRGGSIVVCRMCHITKAGGSHLEMQSRSIDSYVHAIHSFQAFDPGDIDFTDPVEALHYDDHVRFAFPTLGRTNCVACHNASEVGGRLPFDVPDQTKSFPSLSSASDSLKGRTRNIGAVPRYIMGPASRACGGCHRANFINRDDAGGLASFNSHTRTFGYLVETTATNQDDDILGVIIELFSIL